MLFLNTLQGAGKRELPKRYVKALITEHLKTLFLFESDSGYVFKHLEIF